MQSLHRSRAVAAAVSSILFLASGRAWSADSAGTEDSAGPLQEVIVTAQYRKENLQDTPIAITAVSSEELEQQGIRNVQDLGNIVPNSNFVPSNQGPFSTIGMRGVNTTDYIPTTDPGVGVYVDDVYVGTLTGSTLDLLDLDRVEVLRGPQGTLFGKNSLGGAIRMFSAQPKGDDRGNVEVTSGTSHRLDLKGSYDMKLADNLFARVAVASKQIDGYQKVLDFACQMKADGTPQLAGTFPTYVPSNSENAGDCGIGEHGGSRSNSGRVMFRYLATDALEINADGDYSRTDAEAPADTLLTGYHATTPPYGLADTDYSYVNTGTGTPANPMPFYGVEADNRFATPNSPFTTYGYPSDPIGGKIWPTDQITTAYNGALHADYHFNPDLTLKFIGAYRTYEMDWLANGADMPIDLHNVYTQLGHHQKTAELRLEGSLLDHRLDWTSGLYHFDSGDDLGGYVTLPAYAAFGIQNFYQNDRFATKSNSGFLHGEMKFTDALSLTAGVRYTSEKKLYAFDHTNFLTVATPLHYGSNHFDYKVSLDYRWSQQLMTYAMISTGFRSDGAQPRPFTPGQQQVPTEAEKIRAYEVGFKADMLDRRLRLDVSAFLNDYSPRIASGTGMQCNLFNDPDPGPIYSFSLGACPANTPVGANYRAGTGPGYYLWFYYTSAPGKAMGVEEELKYAPFGGLEFNLTSSFYKYKSDVASTAVGYIDPSVREQPEFAGNAGVQYNFNFSKGSLVPRIDAIYRGYRTDGTENLVQRHPDDIIPGYTLVNGRLTYSSADNRWMVSLVAENLLNKFYWMTLASATTVYGTEASDRQGGPGRGREVYATVRRNFF